MVRSTQLSYFKPGAAAAVNEAAVNAENATGVAVTTAKVSWITSRTASNAWAIYTNGSSGAAPRGTFTTASVALPVRWHAGTVSARVTARPQSVQIAAWALCVAGSLRKSEVKNSL